MDDQSPRPDCDRRCATLSVPDQSDVGSALSLLSFVQPILYSVGQEIRSAAKSLEGHSSYLSVSSVEPWRLRSTLRSSVTVLIAATWEGYPPASSDMMRTVSPSRRGVAGFIVNKSPRRFAVYPALIRGPSKQDSASAGNIEDSDWINSPSVSPEAAIWATPARARGIPKNSTCTVAINSPQ